MVASIVDHSPDPNRDLGGGGLRRGPRSVKEGEGGPAKHVAPRRVKATKSSSH